MKKGVTPFFLFSMLVVCEAGCGNRNFVNMGTDSHGHAYGVPSNSIDGYAKAHGISRAEAAKRMRQELVPPNDSHANDPPAQTVSAMPEKVN